MNGRARASWVASLAGCLLGTGLWLGAGPVAQAGPEETPGGSGTTVPWQAPGFPEAGARLAFRPQNPRWLGPGAVV